MKTTVKEVIDYVKLIKSPAFDENTLVKWLNECEGEVQINIMGILPDNCIFHEWEHVTEELGLIFTSNSITFPVTSGFKPGETITISGCATEANNKNVSIVSVSDDGLTLAFAAGVFTAGTETGSVKVLASRSDEALLVPLPFSEMYAEYIMTRVDYNSEEYENYTNESILYNQLFGDYAGWYTRNN